MIKFLFYFFGLITSYTISGQSQPANTPIDLSKDLPSNLKILLPEKELIAELMGGIKYGDRLLELTEKFQVSIRKNYDWYLNHVKNTAPGQPVAYDKKLGLTKEEYMEFLELSKDIEVVSTGNEKVTIRLQEENFSFQSQNQLAFINDLRIDVKNNTVSFKEYKLPFTDTVSITSAKNGFRSKWKGYKWRLEEPSDLGNLSIKDIKTLNARAYTLTIGQLEKNGKSILILKVREVEQGERKTDYEKIIIF